MVKVSEESVGFKLSGSTQLMAQLDGIRRAYRREQVRTLETFGVVYLTMTENQFCMGQSVPNPYRKHAQG